VPTQFKSRDGNSPQLDCSVGGLYYKIYAEGHERRMAAQVVIKPSYITHRRLYLAEEARNYPDPAQFMAAVKETYLEKMINENEDLSFQNFCGQCFRCFNSPFDLQVHKELVHQVKVKADFYKDIEKSKDVKLFLKNSDFSKNILFDEIYFNKIFLPNFIFLL
jgi:hypothetical protein